MKNCLNITTPGLFYDKVACLFYKFSVDIEVFECYVFSAFDVVSVFGNVIETGVFDADVIYMVIIVQSDDEYAKLALFASHILQMDVTDSGSETSVAFFPVLVLQVDAQYGFAALSYGDVAYKYVLDDSATACTGLDTDNTVQVGAVHAAVLHVQVAVSAGDFAADDYAPVAVLHEAVAHDDVFAGDVPFTAVGVASRFDGDAVVACIEGTIFYQYILT